MITYNEIKTELAAGKTEQEIVAKYAANLSTVHDIDVDSLQNYLTTHKLIYMDAISSPIPRWAGGLYDAIKASGNSELIEGMNGLINLLVKPSRKIVETTLPKYGALMAWMLQVAEATFTGDNVGIYNDLAATVNALSGGLRYGPQVTLSVVQSIRADGERSEWDENMKQRATNAAALFSSNAEQSMNEWDDVEASEQWAAAWASYSEVPE